MPNIHKREKRVQSFHVGRSPAARKNKTITIKIITYQIDILSITVFKDYVLFSNQKIGVLFYTIKTRKNLPLYKSK